MLYDIQVFQAECKENTLCARAMAELPRAIEQADFLDIALRFLVGKPIGKLGPIPSEFPSNLSPGRWSSPFGSFGS